MRRENWDARFHYALHPNSELHVLMKDHLRRLGDFRKGGKLNDGTRGEMKADYDKQK